MSSVSDPHLFDADPDPAFQFTADWNPGFFVSFRIFSNLTKNLFL
jgi:hypothetical protein